MSARSPCSGGVSKHARPVLWRPDVSLAVDGIGAVCVSDLPSMQTPGEPVASGSPPFKRPESLSPSGPAQHQHVHVVTGHAQAFPVPLHARQQLHMLFMHGLMLLPLTFSLPAQVQFPSRLGCMLQLLS